MPPSLMPPSPPLLTEEDLETYFEELCHGEYKTFCTLDLATSAQVTGFTLSRMAQLWLKIEQRLAQ